MNDSEREEALTLARLIRRDKNLSHKIFSEGRRYTKDDQDGMQEIHRSSIDQHL
jgi:hypothetical protein